MKTYTTDQIASIAGCHKSTVHRLMSAGKFGPRIRAGHGYTVQAENRDAILAIVSRNTTRKIGYHRKGNGRLPETQAETVTAWGPASEEQADARFIRQPQDSALSLLMEWVKVPAEKRETLVKLAAKFSADDLRILLEL